MKKLNFKNKTFLACVLIALAIATRFLPHPANFTSVAAVAIFSGLYLPKRWAIFTPLAAMFFSDLFIGFYTWQILASVYLSFALTGIISLLARRHKNVFTVLGSTLAGSTLFFLITNFAVWKFSFLYEHNLAGLINCYYMAIPFFKNSLLGDIFYTGILVGSYEAVASWFLSKEKMQIAVK